MKPQQFVIVVDYVPGQGWEAHLDSDPHIGWANADIESMMAAIALDLPAIVKQLSSDGTSGQDRKSYTDTQDRNSYEVSED